MSNYATNYMGFIPAEVRYNRALSADAKLLYTEITAGLNTDGVCRIKAADLEQMYGVSRATINRWLAELEEQQMIFFEGSSRDPRGRLIRIKKDTSDKIAKARKRTAKQDNLIKNEQVEPSLRKNEQVDDYLIKNEQVEPLLNQICASRPYSITSIPPCIPPDTQQGEIEEDHPAKSEQPGSNRFKRPSLQEVLDYAQMTGVSKLTAEQFWLKQESLDWMNGSTPIRKWQPLLHSWKLTERKPAGSYQQQQPERTVLFVELSEEKREQLRQSRERIRQLNADKLKGKVA